MSALKQCQFCGSFRTETLHDITFCSDCRRSGEVTTFREYVDRTQAEIARLTAALAQSRAETQAALAGCVKNKDGYRVDAFDLAMDGKSVPLSRAIQPDTSKLALVREALRFYAGCYEPELSNPNLGPWGANSTDFGEKARAALALIAAQEGE